MRMHELRIDNFMRVRCATIKAKGKHVIISAKNGTGKTSTLEAIWVCVVGPDARNIPEPIHHGETKATIVLDLGEVILTRTFTKSGSTITATAADGSKFRNTAQILDGMLAKYALNPISFLEKRPQDQLDDYLMVAGVKHPIDEVKAICGKDYIFPTDGESCYNWLTRLSADETGAFYLRRRTKHRELDEAKGAVAKQEDHLKTLPEVDEVTTVPELMGEEELLNKRQAKRREAEKEYDGAKKARIEAENKVTFQKTELAKQEKIVNDLRKQLELAEAAYRTMENKVVVADESLLTARAIEADLLAKMNDTPDLTASITHLRERIKQASADQENLIIRRAAVARLQELNTEVSKHEAEHNRLDSILSRLRALRKRILEGVDLGVPGLSVGEGTLLFREVDFKQASLAQGLTVACAIVMRQNPSLKLLRIDNAEHLDDDSTKLILDLADQNDWQVIMTRVDSRNDKLNLEFVEAGVPE